MGTNTAKKRKFNAVDAAIIIVIVAVIGAAAVFFTVRGISDEPSDTVAIEYVVEFRQIREEFADNFAIGTRVTDSVAKYQIGEVLAVNVENSKYSGNDMLTGELAISEYPERVNVRVTIGADAAIGENNIFQIDGGYRISVGTAVHVRTPNYTGTGYCIEIKEES